MEKVSLNSIDEITMRLVHYFITKENYQPIIVNGIQNEIWLENLDKKFRVIRINTNYIHNAEQMEFDTFKTKNILKQIKKKTFTFGADTLSIQLNVGENVKVESNDKRITEVVVDNVKCLTNGKSISAYFPEIKNDEVGDSKNLDFYMNIANDINKETEKKNKIFESTFKKKTIIVTYAIIAINILCYILELSGILNMNMFAMNSNMVKSGEWYRIITSMFMHNGIFHLICNMYSLYMLGVECENLFGKWKYALIYLLSGIFGNLLSGIISMGNYSSVGASGAIFGLMGALLYFGYHYRLYLGDSLKNQLIPIILINIVIGFAVSGVDVWAHIGGLIGGLFVSMAVGIKERTDKQDTINGIIVTSILFIFLCFMLFFR